MTKSMCICGYEYDAALYGRCPACCTITPLSPPLGSKFANKKLKNNRYARCNICGGEISNAPLNYGDCLTCDASYETQHSMEMTPYPKVILGKHPLKRSKQPPLGSKFDNKKLRWDLLPLKPIEQVVRVLTKGANKYSDNNWKHVDNFEDRYYAAAMRHITRWRMGFKRDKESGMPHLAHAICCLIFILWKEGGKIETRNSDH